MQQTQTTGTISPAMSLQEAATYLNSTIRWVRQQIYAGRLSYQQVGKKHMVRRDEVARLLENGWRRNGR